MSLRKKGGGYGNAHPLDGLVQLSVRGWPALAWMPEAGLLTTLLLPPPPCAETRAAKARTSGTQGRILIGFVGDRYNVILGGWKYMQGAT